ncbi:MAG TPA: hypothetical protein PKH07_10815, partial [bacterium]|nr:hypothetical protein [bacterium]
MTQQNKPNIAESLLVSDEVRYRCIQCGDCCRENWIIPVDKETSRTLIERSPEEPLRTYLGGKEAISVSASAVLIYPQRMGICVFLENEGSCYLHRQFGASGKGKICREFPLLVTETPHGIYVGYSFVCRSVREGTAQPELQTVQDGGDAPALETILKTRDHHYRTVGSEARLGSDSRIKLSWSEYLQVEEGLTQLLSRTGTPLGDCLGAGHAYLSLLERFIREVVVLPAGSPFTRENVVSHFVQRMKQDDYALVFRVSAKRKPSGLVKRFVTAMGLSFLAQIKHRGQEHRPGRLALASRVIGEFFHRKTPNPEGMIEASDSILRRYLRHLVWRKDLVAREGPLGGGSLIAAYGGLLFVYGLLMERARRLALQNTIEDAFSLAVRQVERDLIVHAKLCDPQQASRLRWFLGWW